MAFISAILWLFLEILPYLNVHSRLWTYSLITLPPVSTASNFLWFFCLFGGVTRFECPPWTLNLFLNDITTSEQILQFSMISLGIFWLFLDRLPYSSNDKSKVLLGDYLFVFIFHYCKYTHNIFKLWTSAGHCKGWIFGFLDDLFVFVYIDCHFWIILQMRSTYCKRNHVIWTRIGRAI